MKPNAVAAVGSAVGLLALLELGPWQPGWLVLKPNRLVAGEVYSAFAVTPLWGWSLLGLWLTLLGASLLPLRARPWLLAGLASAALVLALLSVGQGGGALISGLPASARASLAGGVWIMALALYVVFFGALGEVPGRGWRRAALVLPGLLVGAALIAAGTLNDLGLARELASQGGDVRSELVRHLALAGSSVLLAAALGVPAAIAAARQARVASVVLPTVNILQTLPSLALFGLMLAPLARLGREVSVLEALWFLAALGVPALLLGLVAWGAQRLNDRLRAALGVAALALAALPVVLLSLLLALWGVQLVLGLLTGAPLPRWPGLGAPLAELGLRGIGMAPALIALTLYALLPIVRNTFTGIKEVPAAAVEAGRGMGMSPGQILRRVELPLALPLIVEGLRASSVLTIGIATVAYLIGAGGLGVFIQRGIDQVVPDLILLGVIPIILLALAADLGLRALATRLGPRGLRA